MKEWTNATTEKLVHNAYLLGKNWDLLNPDFLIAEWQMRVCDNEKVMEELEICECKLKGIGG